MPDEYSPFRLLLRHFDGWASQKQRDVDVDVLERLLDLRSTYDDIEPTYWPAGSVERLLLELVPAKGPVEPFDEHATETTLDGFFRFLRNTGRMAGRSASPAALGKELRRALPAMGERAADRQQWSSGKSLLDYGRSIGIDMDNVPDQATLQGRLQEIQDAWNNLPVHERQRRMPHPGDDETSGEERALANYQTDDPVEALVITLTAHESMPDGDLAAPESVASAVETSDLMTKIQALTEWIGERVEVTSTQAMRPASAHAAYEELGLERWARAAALGRFQHYEPPGVRAMGRDAWAEREVGRSWRNMGDCHALARVWWAAVACQAIEIVGKWAYPRWDREPSPELTVWRGVVATLELLENRMELPGRGIGLAYAFLESYKRERAVVGWQEILDFLRFWEFSPAEARDLGGYDFDFDGIFFWEPLDGACFELADTGAFVTSEEGIALTPFGEIVVANWLRIFS